MFNHRPEQQFQKHLIEVRLQEKNQCDHPPGVSQYNDTKMYKLKTLDKKYMHSLIME